MEAGMSLFIGGCVLLILYLSIRLWVAEHDRNLLMERPVVVPVDYGIGIGLWIAFLITMGLLGIVILWLVGVL